MTLPHNLQQIYDWGQEYTGLVTEEEKCRLNADIKTRRSILLHGTRRINTKVSLEYCSKMLLALEDPQGDIRLALRANKAL